MTDYMLLLLTNTLIFAMLGLGLSVQWRLAGLMNFGIVGFFAIGAYVTSMLAVNGVPAYLSIPAGAAVACIAAYPIGLTTVTLQTDYLAIGLLALGEIIRIGANSWSFVGGASGIRGIPGIFGAEVANVPAWVYLVITASTTAVIVFLLNRITHSTYGLATIATSDDALGASAIGKDVRTFRVKALMLGCLICGIAGGFYAYFLSYISPDNFDPLVTFYVWAGIVIGGRTHLGATFGILIFMGVLEASRFLNDIAGFLPSDKLADLRMMATGLVLIIVLRYLPDGIFVRRNVKKATSERVTTTVE